MKRQVLYIVKRRVRQAGSAIALSAVSLLPVAGAVEDAGGGETVTAETSAIVTAITDAAESLQGDAATVIGAAVALGLVFWGAKVLWSKFKGMAK